MKVRFIRCKTQGYQKDDFRVEVFEENKAGGEKDRWQYQGEVEKIIRNLKGEPGWFLSQHLIARLQTRCGIDYKEIDEIDLDYPDSESAKAAIENLLKNRQRR